MFAFRRLLTLAATGLLALLLAAPAAAAKPIACVGAGWVAPDPATITTRTADGVTFIKFEFFGEHSLCLADGTEVSGTVAGKLWQRVGKNGSIKLRFYETLSVDGGTLNYRGNATLNGAGWRSHVRTVGVGTGALAGIHGRGTFSPVDPVTGAFTDEIFYVYR